MMDKKPNIKEVIPDAGRMIEGMRDTGYSITTAIADLIDNSISAHANNVSVTIEEVFGDRIYVTVVDDGDGMTLEELEEAMRYGSKVRSDLNSLGKFGLGLKTASTAFSTRFSAISCKGESAEINKATWDLEHVRQTNRWELQLASPSESQVEVLREVAASHGTSIHWEVVDRLLTREDLSSPTKKKNALQRIERDLDEHLGLVFQRFIEPKDSSKSPVDIQVNGKRVEAFDPFCEDETETEKVIDNSPEVELENGTKVAFRVRGFVIPRKEQFSSTSAERRARVTNDNQGIYIYREGRLIHGPDWLRMFSKEPHASLARIEMSFDHRLDELFNVDIKKSRILLNENIAEYLKTKVAGPVRTFAQKRYREGRGKDAHAKSADIHGSSNSIMAQYEKDIVDNTIIGSDAAKGVATIRNPFGVSEVRLLKPDEARDDQPYVMTFPDMLEGLLWEPALNKENRGVALNTSHPFYQKVYLPLKQTDVNIQSFDYLIYALAMGEMNTINEKVKAFYEDLRRSASRSLRILSDRLPEVDIDESE